MASWITLDVADGVAVVSMARPPVNAMSRAFMAELAAALDRVEQDGAVRVAVITGGLPGMFSGGASEAIAAGLVSRVVDDERLLDEARALGRRLASQAPIALAKIKECVERGLGRPLDEGLAEEARCYVKAYLTEDAREGILAFLDKRPARFRGR